MSKNFIQEHIFKEIQYNSSIVCYYCIVFREFCRSCKRRVTRTTEQLIKKSRVEANLAKMILINGICSFILRLPEVITYVADVIFALGPDRKPSVIDHVPQIPNTIGIFMLSWLYMRESMIDITESFYGVSCILPIFFYWRYNSGFRISLQRKLFLLTFAASSIYLFLRL